MKEAEHWSPTKYVSTNRGLRANRDFVAGSSILAADIAAKFFDRAIPRYVQGNLLDLGCGTVPLYGAYAPFIEDNTCVDWSGSAHDSVHIDICHDLSQLPLPIPSASFDTVILSDVLEHMPYPQDLLREVARCARSGAHVLISVPFLYRPHEVPRDFWRFTEWGIIQMLNDVGLDIEEITANGGPIAVGIDVFGKSLAMLGRPANRLAGAIQRLASRFMVTKSGLPDVQWLRARDMPLSYSVVARVP